MGVQNKIRESFEKWRSSVYGKAVAKVPERQKEFTTPSFAPVQPLYSPCDINEDSYTETIGGLLDTGQFSR